MQRRSFLKLACGSVISSAPAARRFNILFFLADDLGWHDIGPLGNTFIDTPNLSRLAAQGTVFTNAYAACPVCSPTRASILTGQYPARLQLTDWISGRAQWPYARLLTPPFRQQLPLTEPTIPKLLRPLGYRSASIGKWHLGGEGYSPVDQGFDVNIGGSAAGHPPTYFGPLTLPGLKLEPGEFLTQRLSYEGSRFIKERSTRPFFLYEPQFTVHMPLQAKADLIEKYRARSIVDVDPIYCAMVESADQSVGQLLKAVDEAGQAQNTIVVFFSDNGGVRYQAKRAKPVTNNSPLRAGKGHLYEGGIRESLIVRWPGITKPGSVVHQPVSSVDFLPTFIDGLNLQALSNSIDGVSLLPLLQGKAIPERPLFWHYPHYSDQGGKPSAAVRHGNWKLIEFFEDQRLELFNLENDLGERHNLVKQEPGRAARLHTLLRSWRTSVNAAMPSLNPNYDPRRASEGLTGYEQPTLPV